MKEPWEKPEEIILPVIPENLIGKWNLTQTMFVAPNDDLIPCDCDYRRLVSLEFTPDGRFDEVARDRLQMIVRKAGTYELSDDRLSLQYDDCDGFDELYQDTLSITTLHPPGLLMLAPQRLPFDLIALQFFKEGGVIDFAGVWTQTELYVRAEDGWGWQWCPDENLKTWDFDDPDDCMIYSRRTGEHSCSVSYSHKEGELIITSRKTGRERYRIEPISAHEIWAYRCGDTEQNGVTDFYPYRIRIRKRA